MGYFAGAPDLRNLMAVAGKLRLLAADATAIADRDLYLTAAAALEARARWLSVTLPEDRDGPECDSHRPVDVRI